MSTLKESSHIELLEYCKIRKIDDQPTMALWIDWTLGEKERVIKVVQHQINKKLMKFWVQIPGSVEEAYMLDKEKSDDLWKFAIQKELKNTTITFHLLQDDKNLLVGLKKILSHIIFDVKLDLMRGVRLVTEGHRNKSVPDHLVSPKINKKRKD